MIAVIGDIHGCYLTLVELYEQILKKYPDIKVYSVGDLVDRGNKSFEVMEFIIENNKVYVIAVINLIELRDINKIPLRLNI